MPTTTSFRIYLLNDTHNGAWTNAANITTITVKLVLPYISAKFYHSVIINNVSKKIIIFQEFLIRPSSVPNIHNLSKNYHYILYEIRLILGPIEVFYLAKQ